MHQLTHVHVHQQTGVPFRPVGPVQSSPFRAQRTCQLSASAAVGKVAGSALLRAARATLPETTPAAVPHVAQKRSQGDREQ